MSWLIRKFRNINAIIYEIRNWFFVMKTIRKHCNTADWQRFNLRSDWIGRIYTVLNPELPGDAGDPMEVLKFKYTERLQPINLYMQQIGLSLAITAAYEEVPESNSFLVVYVPIFNVLTVWKVFVFILFCALFFLTPANTYTMQCISWLWHQIF